MQKTEVCSETTHANRHCKLCFFVLIITPYYNHIQISFRFSFGITECMRMILLMEEILHHLGCIKPGISIFTISTGAGFLPSTVSQRFLSWCWRASETPETSFVETNSQGFQKNSVTALMTRWSETHIGGSVDEWQVAIWKLGEKSRRPDSYHQIFFTSNNCQPVIDPRRPTWKTRKEGDDAFVNSEVPLIFFFFGSKWRSKWRKRPSQN